MVNIEGLIKSLSPDRVKRDEPLSLHTTIGIGGPADLFYEAKNSSELIKAVRLARSFEVPVTIIGDGRNILVSDSGIAGLVVRNHSERVQVKPQRSIVDFIRHRRGDLAEVVIDSGVDVDVAIDKLVSLGLVGLESLVLEPGTIEAKTRNGEGVEVLKRISILDASGSVKSVSFSDLGEDDIVTDTTYLLSYGETKEFMKKLKLIRKKRNTMFGASAGFVFEDISEDERAVFGYGTRDVGLVIGEVLNMKGFKVGGMAISKTNQNVIVNSGKGKGSEFVAIVEEIRRRARETIGLELVEKVVRLTRMR